MTIDLTNILDRIVLSEHKKWRFRASRFQNFLVDPTPPSPLSDSRLQRSRDSSVLENIPILLAN